LKKGPPELDGKIQKSASPKHRIYFLACDPVYQCPAERYGLILKSLHRERDKMPNPDQWQESAAISQTHPAKCMPWSHTPDNHTKEELDTIHAEVSHLGPAQLNPLPEII
jgi:hypothetical protein